MQQPELGKRLTTLRKAKNLTQEELVDKSRVSVRTIQRIEAGEVVPRTATIKILVGALGETYESFSLELTSLQQPQKSGLTNASPNTVLIAAIAGAVYLVTEISLGVLDIAWIADHQDWGGPMNAAYIGLTMVMIISFTLFARGFIVLGTAFENSLLKAISYMLIVATCGKGIWDVATLSIEEVEHLWLPYGGVAVMLGALSIGFGIALLRLQDSMGQLCRIAGILEIVLGCTLVTVVLFFLAYVILIPAVVVEIVVLYRGYDYLCRPASASLTHS